VRPCHRAVRRLLLFEAVAFSACPMSTRGGRPTRRSPGARTYSIRPVSL
jgi:hypothetical protein